MLPDRRDELLGIIARLMEDLTSEAGPLHEGVFSGYAIIASPGGIPTVIRIFPEDQRENWEVAVGDCEVYITVQLPAAMGSEPSVSFQPSEVRISFSGETHVVNLPVRIDVRSCSCRVKNGVLDITCRKA